jgi:alpha-1,3-fucosyltransferase
VLDNPGSNSVLLLQGAKALVYRSACIHSYICSPFHPIQGLGQQNTPQKSGLAVTLISHCGAPSERDNYIRELQRSGLSVDVYGGCGNLSYPFKRLERDRYYQELATHYKFYLSFENSFCLDYVTEKMFLALRYNWIPVVRGAAEYSKFVPENSVIDASLFKGPAELASYLKLVASNDTLYRSYFKWKETYEAADSMDVPWVCSACEKLRKYNKRKSYDDIYGWWVAGSHCVPREEVQSWF